MSDEYSLPDASQPFRSAEEQALAFASPRYKTDSAFRSNVEARVALGVKHSDATPRASQPRGCQRIQMGAENEAVTTHQAMRIDYTEQELQDEQTKQRLLSEKDALQKEIARQQEEQKLRGDKDYLNGNDPTVFPGSEKMARMEKIPFASDAEVVAAMATSGYKNDPRVRAHVERRMALPRK